jgi:hypothetical protein
MHICMETTQGNSCIAVFISNSQKRHVFLFILPFFFYNIRQQDGRMTPEWGLTPVGVVRWQEKGSGG